MKGLITQLLLVTLVIGCNTNEKREISNKLNNKNMIQQEQPLYSLEITSGNPYESYVNDVILEKDYLEGSSDTELLINDLILESGKQEIKIKLLPNKGKNIVDKLGAEYFEAKIYCYKYGFNSYRNRKRELIQSFKIKSIVEGLPFIINTWSFEVKVPYRNKGWSNSVDLSKENQEKLIIEAKQMYEHIRLILNEGNYNKYLELLGKRDNEVFISIYADKELKKEDGEYMVNRIIKSKNNMADIELYKAFLYGNNKLIRLELDNGKSILYGSDNSKNYWYDIFLHRPKPGAPLEVIR